MNMLAEHIKEYIQPYPSRYTRGEFEIRVLPHEDLDYEGTGVCSRSFLMTSPLLLLVYSLRM